MATRESKNYPNLAAVQAMAYNRSPYQAARKMFISIFTEKIITIKIPPIYISGFCVSLIALSNAESVILSINEPELR